jgi:CBS domain-containing protein
MSIGEYCNREVVVAQKGESVYEAARLMRRHHVGNVVVVEQREENTFPVGILTDRDLVVELLAPQVDPDSLTIGDVMSAELLSVTEETALLDAIKLMRSKGVRRLVVVTAEGTLAGLLAVDDILELVVEQLSDLTALIANEYRQEQQQR